MKISQVSFGAPKRIKEQTLIEDVERSLDSTVRYKKYENDVEMSAQEITKVLLEGGTAHFDSHLFDGNCEPLTVGKLKEVLSFLDDEIEIVSNHDTATMCTSISYEEFERPEFFEDGSVHFGYPKKLLIINTNEG